MSERPDDLTRANCKSRMDAVINLMGIKPELTDPAKRKPIESNERICLDCPDAATCRAYGFHEYWAAQGKDVAKAVEPAVTFLDSLGNEARNHMMMGESPVVVLSHVIGECVAFGYWLKDRGLPPAPTPEPAKVK